MFEEIVSLLYFAIQPISLVLMLFVITRMSNQEGKGNNLVHLFVDNEGNYRFFREGSVSTSEA